MAHFDANWAVRRSVSMPVYRGKEYYYFVRGHRTALFALISYELAMAPHTRCDFFLIKTRGVT